MRDEGSVAAIKSNCPFSVPEGHSGVLAKFSNSLVYINLTVLRQGVSI